MVSTSTIIKKRIGMSFGGRYFDIVFVNQLNKLLRLVAIQTITKTNPDADHYALSRILIILIKTQMLQLYDSNSSFPYVHKNRHQAVKEARQGKYCKIQIKRIHKTYNFLSS